MKFMFNGVALSDARGNLNKTGVVWVHLSYLSTLNYVQGNSTFKWSAEAAAVKAGCRVSEASDLLESAVEHGVVKRTKTRVGDKTPWRYTEGDEAWDLYVEAVMERLCDPVINERRYETARGLAIRHGFMLGPEKEILGQLAARTTGGELVTSTREVTGWVNDSYESSDRQPIHQTTTLRAMKRLESAGLLRTLKQGRGRTPTRLWVAATDEEYEAQTQEAAALLQADASLMQVDTSNVTLSGMV